MPLLNIPAVAFTRRKYGKNKKKKVGSRPVSVISGISDDAASQRSKSKSRSPERTRLTSYGTEKSLKVTVRMKEKGEKNKSPGNVYYKDDEDRFTQQHTLKLKTFSEYDVKMEVEPPQEITYLVLGGRRHENLQIMNNPEEDTKAVYKFVWSTKKIKTTDRKFRTVLPCVIKFKPYKELVFNMQVKFYDNEEVAHYTGETLKFLDLDCAVGSGKDKSTTMYPPIRFN